MLIYLFLVCCRILDLIKSFEKIVETPSNRSNMTTQFIYNNLAVSILDTNASNLFSNLTVFISLDDTNSLNRVNIIDSSTNTSTSFNASLFLPPNVLEARGLQDNLDTPLRVSYAVFSRDILFQSNLESEFGYVLADGNRSVGSPIVSASLVTNDGQDIVIENLAMPVIIEFVKPSVSIKYVYAYAVLSKLCIVFFFQNLRANETSAVCVFWDTNPGIHIYANGLHHNLRVYSFVQGHIRSMITCKSFPQLI